MLSGTAWRIAAGLLLSAITAGVSWGDFAAGPDRFLPVLPDGKGVETVMQHYSDCTGGRRGANA